MGWYDNQVTYNQTAFAEVLHGSTWTVQLPASPMTGSPSQLDGVSSAGPTLCRAVGSYENLDTGFTSPLAESWNGNRWTLQTTAKPPLAYASLSSVSCIGAACEAVGSVSGSTVTGPFAEGLTSGGWTRQTLEKVTGAGYNVLESISCAAADACHAVGASYSYAPAGPLAETWNGARWVLDSIPSPSGSLGGALNGISCAAATACEAVGTYTATSYLQAPLAEIRMAGHWSIQTVPEPPHSTGSALNGVSCTAADACTAVGFYQGSSYEDLLLAETWNGTAWKVVSLPTPAGFQYGSLSSVSCVANSCTAVGWYENASYREQPIAATEVGSSWTVKTLPNPPGSFYGTLSAVACVAVNACTAVGGYYPDYSFQAPLAEVWNGSTWKEQLPANGGKGATLAGISCAAAGSCVAVGSAAEYGYPSQAPIVETLNGTTWALQPTPGLGGAVGNLASVSCLSAGVCAAAGTQYSATGTTLVEGEGGA